jgi:hypothetical protein
MGANVTRHQSNCLVQLSFGSVPVPTVPPTSYSEGIVDFVNAVIQSYSMPESLFRLPVSERLRHFALQAQDVSRSRS